MKEMSAGLLNNMQDTVLLLANDLHKIPNMTDESRNTLMKEMRKLAIGNPSCRQSSTVSSS
jgi:hypothetical protein